MAIGDIGDIKDELEFDLDYGYYPSIIHISGNVYAIVHRKSKRLDSPARNSDLKLVIFGKTGRANIACPVIFEGG